MAGDYSKVRLTLKVGIMESLLLQADVPSVMCVPSSSGSIECFSTGFRAVHLDDPGVRIEESVYMDLCVYQALSA